VVQGKTLVAQPFLDITAKVLSTGTEQGLWGWRSIPTIGGTDAISSITTDSPMARPVIAEYHTSPDSNRSSDTEKIILTIPQPYRNHKGGMIEFGPDGLLYIGMGDGGSGGDPQNRAQNLYDLLGKMLRIDVDRGNPYAIPDTNPFAKGNGHPEIYAYGFRNPWRFSFDRDTGDLWAGDVGQNDWEEIDVVLLGGNYGWRIMEGTHCFSPKVGCHSDGLILPIAEYPTRSPRCSIIGGVCLPWGSNAVEKGTYVYGDFCAVRDLRP
jgi:hypothetical protein